MNSSDYGMHNPIPETTPGPAGGPGILRSIATFIATGMYSGYFPIFPGTAGSFVGAVVLWFTPEFFYPYLIAATLILGTWAADSSAKRWGKDPSAVVIDEVAGIFITLAIFPKDFTLFCAGFLFFRILDIVKPFPCRRLEKAQGGYGIMLDDIAAALYACILLYAVFIFIN